MALTKKYGVAQATTIVEHKDGATTEEKDTVAVVASEQPMANVGVTLAHTKNLGNYENIKVSVSLFYPCLPGEEDATFDKVMAWTDAKLEQKIMEINASLQGD